MKLAASNIAWAAQDADAAHAMLARHGFAGLEIAPALAFPGEADPMVPSDAAVAHYRAGLAGHGLELISMQSLLFGVSGAQLFGTAQELGALETGLGRAIALAGRLGIPNLVFGSPGNRAYGPDYTPDSARARAIAVLHRLGDKALAHGCRLAIEPNPASYGTNFLTTLAEAAAFVAAADHPGLTLNLDLGAAAMNGEEATVAGVHAALGDKVSHVHISEPELAPAPAAVAPLAATATRLLAQGYRGWFSIEMRRPADADPLDLFELCLARAAAARAQALVAGGADA